MSEHHQSIGSSNKDLQKVERQVDRRTFLTKTSLGLGSLALGSLFNIDNAFSAVKDDNLPSVANGLAGFPNVAPKAKRIVYLFQSGGPSQIETYDYKPKLVDLHGQDLPDSVRQGQRLTGMSADQTVFPITSSIFKFQQYGQSRKWVSELMPHTAEIVDDLCFIKSMYTEQINHDPAITFFQTGHQLPGRPSIGAWLSYGLGSLNQNLPSFIVLVSKNAGGQPLYARLWGNGFLPTRHQGVQFQVWKGSGFVPEQP